MNKTLVRSFMVFSVLFCIPFLITLFSEKDTKMEESQFNTGIYVYVNEGNDVIAIDFDEYLVGVVAAAMPADYELETLKAQAVICRTYALNIIGERKSIESSELNQSYKNNEVLKESFGKDYDERYQKIVTAVLETTEEVICYEDQLISPVYCRCSNGSTRNAAEVWGSELPYLKAVDSSKDVNYELFEVRTTYQLEECLQLMQKSYKDFQMPTQGLGDSIQIIEKDAYGYVKSIQMGNRTFTGEEFRYAMNLPSSSFDIKAKSSTITLISHGAGHGVGLSQFGANEMAKEGSSYEAILTYYYTGTTIKASVLSK